MKRLFDLVLVCSASIFLAVPILLIAILIRCLLGSPVLFKQNRPGRYGKSFMMIKFRTMTDTRDSSGRLLPDSERLTPFGRFLRSSSLDELPELWNVLKGDMSLVGPRPLLIQYMPFYTEIEKKRFLERPGITGLAQINGRNFINWDERLAFDVLYVDNISLILDIKIILKTLFIVIRREGVIVDPSSAMLSLDDERRNN